MYPDNKDIKVFGETVHWPGVDDSGKFTNGSFDDPLVKPSFVPAETINLILDNLSGLIKKMGEAPNNTSVSQLADVFASAAIASKGIIRDAHGRAQIGAPAADDDIARKADVDLSKNYTDNQVASSSHDTLNTAKTYTNEKISAEASTRFQGDTDTLNRAKNYTDSKIATGIPVAAPTASGAAGLVGNSSLYARSDHAHPSEIAAYTFGETMGYAKWRNGLLIQWGEAFLSPYSSIKVNLPVSYNLFFSLAASAPDTSTNSERWSSQPGVVKNNLSAITLYHSVGFHYFASFICIGI